jgi:hypothetical protein
VSLQKTAPVDAEDGCPTIVPRLELGLDASLSEGKKGKGCELTKKDYDAPGVKVESSEVG